MNSSDSEDDCYGNIAQKLQSLKNNYQEDKVECSNLLNDSTEINEIIKKSGNPPETVAESSRKDDDEAPDETFIDQLLAGSSKRVTRKSAKKRGSLCTDGAGTGSKMSTRRSKAKEPVSDNNIAPNEQVIQPPSASRTPRGRGRNSRGQRIPRGRNRGRGGNRHIWQVFNQPLIPTYSVGNTDEYPDESDNIQLFSNAKIPQKDIVVIDEADPLDENEELSVKVYWQSSEFFKFTIRKYQKLTQIFEYFSKKENISYDKLLFTFNDRILTEDDTPDTIEYSIAKFIDGGIINQSVTKFVKKNQIDVKNGIRIKFQCQNIKKPFETTIQLDEKLSTSMMKCAEHFDMPLSKLKFQFDGDLISATDTAQDLELEGGECFDVKILS